MKNIVLFVIILSVSAKENISTENFRTLELEEVQLLNRSIPINNRLLQELKIVRTIRNGGIIAVINDYADQVFTNVQKLILRNGLDPVELPDQDLKLFPTGSISLTEGWLEDTATIARYKNVSVSYSSFTKQLTIVVPIQFTALMSIYKYHAKVFILNWTGNVQGKIEDLRANIELTFDFKTYEASIQTFDIKESGSISLTFSGNGLLDWIVSRMTSAVTYFLHPVIIRIIEFIVKGGLETAVKATNEAIIHVLHNETVTTTMDPEIHKNYLYI